MSPHPPSFSLALPPPLTPFSLVSALVSLVNPGGWGGNQASWPGGPPSAAAGLGAMTLAHGSQGHPAGCHPAGCSPCVPLEASSLPYLPTRQSSPRISPRSVPGAPSLPNPPLPRVVRREGGRLGPRGAREQSGREAGGRRVGGDRVKPRRRSRAPAVAPSRPWVNPYAHSGNSLPPPPPPPRRRRRKGVGPCKGRQGGPCVRCESIDVEC